MAIDREKRVWQTALPNHNDFISASKNISACRELLDEIEKIRDLLFHFRELNKNSQIIGQKVFLNEALRTEVLFHHETALL